MEKDPSLETVIQRIKDTYSKQTSELEVPIHVIEERLREYRQAAKADLLSEYLERNGLPAGQRRSETAALALYEALHNLPEFKPVEVVVPEVPDDEPETLAQLGTSALQPEATAEWPILTKMTPDRPLVIFGGYVLEEKLQWLTSWGVTAEWASNSAGIRASASVQRVAARIRSNAYTGVIVLNELISHDESDALLTACRASGTLYAMGRKAGKGQLRALCHEFETRLKEGSK